MFFQTLTLATLSATPDFVQHSSCDLAIIGAGPGGVYTAWRYLAEKNGSVCLFERSDRAGGRIYTLRNQGPEEDLTVDIGAYRYAWVPCHSLPA